MAEPNLLTQNGRKKKLADLASQLDRLLEEYQLACASNNLDRDLASLRHKERTIVNMVAVLRLLQSEDRMIANALTALIGAVALVLGAVLGKLF